MTELVATEDPKPAEPGSAPPLAVDPAPAETALAPQISLQVELERQQKRVNRDKVQGTQLNRSVEAKNSLRMAFSLELNKLDNLETRDTAVRALKACLETNVSREALKLFLSILASPKTQSAKGRCAELKVIQMILKTFKALLLETAGAGLNRVYSIILAYFSDRSREVQEAVGECMCDLYECALGLPASQSLQFMLEPLSLVLTSGTELNAQQTAAVTLRKWVCSLSRDQAALILDIAKRVTALFVKLRPGFPDLISTLGYLLQNFGLEFMLADLLMVMKKLLAYFGLGMQSGHYGEREACRLLGEIYKKLGAAGANLGEIKQEVLSRLKAAKAHRVAEVQREAAAAFSIWSSETPPPRAQTSLPKKPAKAPVSTTRLRTMRDIMKQRKAEDQSSPPPPEDQWGVYKPKFLTRGSGRYVPQLGYGKLDLSLALKSRPSLKDFIKARGRPPPGNIEIYAKSPTEANRIVPRTGFSESPDRDQYRDEEHLEEPPDENPDEQANEAEIAGEDQMEEEKEGEDGQATMPAFQVEAPVAATEAGNPNAWNRIKAKKTEVKPSLPDIETQPLPENQESVGDASQRSSASGRLKKAVGKTMAVQNLLRLKGVKSGKTEGEPQPGEAAAEVPPAKEKSSNSALFGAFGKSIVQKLTSRSAQQDSTSPKSTPPETQLSAPPTLDRGKERMPLQFFSPLVSARLKAGQQPPRLEAKQGAEELKEGETGLGEERKSDASAEEEPQEAEILPAADAPSQDLSEIAYFIESAVMDSVESMDKQFEEMEAMMTEMKQRIVELEARIATKRRIVRARNSAPPKYKSRIHPPVVPTASRKKTEFCDSVAQTRPETAENESQTSSLALYKLPGPAKPEVDAMSRTWLRALTELNSDKMQPAYRRILRTGDDVYLLRLMVTTGPRVDALNVYTLGTLLARLSQLLCQSFVPSMVLDWIEGSVQNGVFFELGGEDQQGMLETVRTLSEEDTEDGWKARSLYEYLTSE